MRIRVLLFAALREAVGEKEVDLEMDEGSSLGELLARLEASAPPVRAFRGRVVVALNRERAALDAELRPGDEVALLPPVSGGSGAARTQVEPLSLDALIEEVRHPGCGAIVTFTGVVRDVSRGHRIERLEYEAYEPMAVEEMEAIRSEVRGRWPEVRLAIAHRVGRLEKGEAAVVIAASAPHRRECFEACRFAIEALKSRVPIWKKEFAEDGASWVEGTP
jgi:molybdopterin synthase catalytic subunit